MRARIIIIVIMSGFVWPEVVVAASWAALGWALGLMVVLEWRLTLDRCLLWPLHDQRWLCGFLRLD